MSLPADSPGRVERQRGSHQLQTPPSTTCYSQLLEAPTSAYTRDKKDGQPLPPFTASGPPWPGDLGLGPGGGPHLYLGWVMA